MFFTKKDTNELASGAYIGLRSRLRRRGFVSSVTLLTATSYLLSGCASITMQKVSPGEAPIVLGPKARPNLTPVEPALACLADKIIRDHKPRLTFAVGNIRDYTGRYNINEGNAVTQGAALMVESALGDLGNSIDQVERLNPRITQMELGYMDQRELGDGRLHKLGPKSNVVTWMPYYGGTILRSQYYIIGGITELNYNIQSGGFQLMENLAGPKARTFTENVAVDLELVDTQTTQIVKTISMEKQITGYSIGAGIFRFFGSNLWDLNIGAKNQEPLQLGIRTVLQEATVKLVAAAERLNANSCLARVRDKISEETAQELMKEHIPFKLVLPPKPPGVEQVDTKPSGNIGSNTTEIGFDFGSTALPPGQGAELARIAHMAPKSPVTVELVAPGNENWSPQKRHELVRERIDALREGLVAHGLANPIITTVWSPPRSSSAIYHDGPGLQKVAIVTVQ
jgi:curli biogenesis system outer membrane secretion channel CsgG